MKVEITPNGVITVTYGDVSQTIQPQVAQQPALEAQVVPEKKPRNVRGFTEEQKQVARDRMNAYWANKRANEALEASKAKPVTMADLEKATEPFMDKTATKPKKA